MTPPTPSRSARRSGRTWRGCRTGPWTLVPGFRAPGAGTEAVERELSGFMDVGAVELPDDAEYYLCGPLPFLKSVRSALIGRGVRPQDIQYEVFGPDLWLADFQ